MHSLKLSYEVFWSHSCSQPSFRILQIASAITSLSQFCFFFLKIHSVFQHVHGHRAILGHMCQESYPVENLLLSSSSQKLPVTPLQRLGLSEPLPTHAGVLTSLVLRRSCTDNHSHGNFTWTIALLF